MKSRWFLEASGFLFDGGKMSLFEEKNRVFLGPKSCIDGSFEYLDRSGRSEARRVRECIETWLERYPIEHRTEMEIRLRDRNDRNFASASFELILFACVSSLGYSIQIHPRLPNGNNKRPDFLVRRADGEDFYLEAVLASEFDAAEIAARRRTNVVLEALEGINSPNFFIGIIAEGNPDTPPPTKKLKRDIQDWLKMTQRSFHTMKMALMIFPPILGNITVGTLHSKRFLKDQKPAENIKGLLVSNLMALDG